MTQQFVAFSGGKDSTCMAARMAELGEKFSLIFTPTGNELPEVMEHIHATAKRIKRPLEIIPNKSLDYWIKFHNALPSWRMRWCTRQIKILPCIEFLRSHPDSVLCVGLRYDEEERVGLYGEYATYRYPLREWEFKLKSVLYYLKWNNWSVPKRTDCALCYDQRLSEWYALWKYHPDEWKKGVQYEKMTGHTFRSPGRDQWPASLEELAREFCRGRLPRGVSDNDRDAPSRCRVCRF
jgi:hypothetical protein